MTRLLVCNECGNQEIGIENIDFCPKCGFDSIEEVRPYDRYKDETWSPK